MCRIGMSWRLVSIGLVVGPLISLGRLPFPVAGLRGVDYGQIVLSVSIDGPRYELSRILIDYRYSSWIDLEFLLLHARSYSWVEFQFEFWIANVEFVLVSRRNLLVILQIILKPHIYLIRILGRIGYSVFAQLTHTVFLVSRNSVATLRLLSPLGQVLIIPLVETASLILLPFMNVFDVKRLFHF